MTSANEQVITAFEVNGMSPEEIALDLDLDLLAVKAILHQNSSDFRKAAKDDDTLQFKTSEAEEMKAIILNIARYEEDDQHLKFKAAKFVLEDKKGRLDVGKELGHNTFNFQINNFKEQMAKALQAAERTKAMIIDTTATNVNAT